MISSFEAASETLLLTVAASTATTTGLRTAVASATVAATVATSGAMKAVPVPLAVASTTIPATSVVSTLVELLPPAEPRKNCSNGSPYVVKRIEPPEPAAGKSKVKSDPFVAVFVKSR